MIKTILNAEQQAYVLDNCYKESSSSMGRKFGIDNGVIVRFIKNNGIIIPRSLSRSFAAAKLKGKTSVTPEQDEEIKKLYLEIPVKTLAKQLNLSDTCLRCRMKQLGLVVPPEIIEQRRKDSQIKKGTPPPNKGKKQTEYLSPEQIEKAKETWFKKGDIPANAYNEPGKITVRHAADKRGGRPYKYICLGLARWVPYHTYLWEKENGPVPKGHCLWFKDGNSLNCVLGNLELITRKENYARNHPAVRLGDRFVARCIVGRNGDPELIIDQPELIELKRQQLKLSKEIKNHDKNANGK